MAEAEAEAEARQRRVRPKRRRRHEKRGRRKGVAAINITVAVVVVLFAPVKCHCLWWLVYLASQSLASLNFCQEEWRKFPQDIDCHLARQAAPSLSNKTQLMALQRTARLQSVNGQQVVPEAPEVVAVFSG